MEPTLAEASATKRTPKRRRLWLAVDDLIDRAPDMRALESHGLHLIAAKRRRELGLDVDDNVYAMERSAALAVLSAPALLERIRLACEGTLVLIKGYEIALLYEDPASRPFVDLDLLVEDSEATHQALLEAGFTEVDEPEKFIGIHHLRPLWLPGFPLSVEIHHAPKWPDGLTPPPTREVLEAAVPSAIGIEGLSTLPPAYHAIVVAAHSWAHLPLRRIQELADVAALMELTDRSEADALAQRWGASGFWNTTMAVVESLFYGKPQPRAQRVWARHLAAARERTVFEVHLERWISPFSTLPARKALPRLVETIGNELRAAENETWREKAARARLAFLNAARPRSLHEDALGPAARRRPRPRRR
jgi:putative nucleotidyltransferase-like protein